MRVVGFLATGIAGIAVIVALVAAGTSVGDIKRYMRIRKM